MKRALTELIKIMVKADMEMHNVSLLKRDDKNIVRQKYSMAEKLANVRLERKGTDKAVS